MNELLTILIVFLFLTALVVWQSMLVKKLLFLQKRILRDLRKESDAIKSLQAVIKSHREMIEMLTKQNSELQQFIIQADANLKTIVNEYEVNGVPLGWDRNKRAVDGQRIDYISGI